MYGLNLTKFKNRTYPLFKNSLFSFASIIVVQKVAIIIIPCLLISFLAFAGNERAIFFNSGSMLGESFFKHIIHHVDMPFITPLHIEIVFSDFRSKSGPQFCASDSAPLEFGGSQGKKITEKCPKKNANNTDKTCALWHDVISYLCGAFIGIVMVWLWFCYQDHRDYGQWD